MRCHLQKVMPKDGIIRNFTEAKHGRLSKVDHKPEKNQRMHMSSSFYFIEN